ncbi:MAG TPA: GNAT family N-acetyltransferase [Desulfuromonadales bacterium]|nr:GNAT family N-acetyltransferase [Desulfuromonadales bacterium]
MSITVEHKPDEQQFQTRAEGHLAHLDYRRDADVLTLEHTEVPAALEGRGIGSSLAREALEFARREKLKVLAPCSFVAAYIERHPEYQSLLAE